eukprot:15463983-Alexandrium_andersonii.AAC.1
MSKPKDGAHRLELPGAVWKPLRLLRVVGVCLNRVWGHVVFSSSHPKVLQNVPGGHAYPEGPSCLAPKRSEVFRGASVTRPEQLFRSRRALVMHVYHASPSVNVRPRSNTQPQAKGRSLFTPPPSCQAPL